MINIARNQSLSLDYKNLVFNTLKKKYLYFLLGLGVTSIALIAVFSWLLPQYELIPFNKKGLKDTRSNAKLDGMKQYKVKPGEYLWNIAEKTYGSGFNAFDIAKANKISEPYILNAGQWLLLPNVKVKQPTAGEIGEAASAKVTFFGSRYTVKSGDNLSQIAQEVYGDENAWTRIAQANKISNPDGINEGDVLTIPR